MKRLFVDTGVALDLVIHELANLAPRGVYRWMMPKLARLKTRAQRDKLYEEIRGRFGAFHFSSGVFLELDKHAESGILGGKNRAHTDSSQMREFWTAVEAFLSDLRADRSVQFHALPWPPKRQEYVIRFGMVDAHILDLLLESEDNWLTTIDGELEAAAADATNGRTVHVP